jgi:transcription antitermination factor NusG
MKSIDPSLHWFVATFRPRKALDAMHVIRKAGFDVYLPRKRVDRWHRRLRIRQEVELPLMHPYLFVGFARDAQLFKAVTDMDEVGEFLRTADRTPIPVPVNLIEAIFIAEVNMEFDETTKARKHREESLERLFPIGSAVKLVEDLKSVLDGAKGVVAGHDNKRDRLKIEFGMLSSWLERDEVEAA